MISSRLELNAFARIDFVTFGLRPMLTMHLFFTFFCFIANYWFFLSAVFLGPYSERNLIFFVNQTVPSSYVDYIPLVGAGKTIPRWVMCVGIYSYLVWRGLGVK